jgi:hypothetical protein
MGCAREEHVNPHELVVAAREWEHPDEPEKRIAGERPEHGSIFDDHIHPRQHVIDSQVAGRLREVGGVEGRVALVGQVDPILELRLLDRARARWCEAIVDKRMVQSIGYME